MDALIATIFAGVVVAVIGAFAAYYFSGRRERQKQVYETRRDEEKRGAEALSQIQAQASGIVDDVKSWAADAAQLPEGMPDTGLKGLLKGLAYSQEMAVWVRRMLPQYEEVVQQRDSIAAEMGSLRLYYREQAPSLPITARNLVDSFNKDFDARYNALSSRLQDYREFRQRFKLKEDLTAVQRGLWTAVGIVSLDAVFGPHDPVTDAQINRVKEDWAGLPEAASYAQDWDFGPYQIAFEREIQKL